VHIARKEYQPAIRDLDTAMRLSPKFAAAMARRAEAWIGCGNARRALADLDEAIATDPLYGPAYRQKAWLLATHPDVGVRDAKAAIDAGKKATELLKDAGGEAWEALAAAYAAAGEFNDAISWQKKASADTGYVKETGDRVKKRLELYEDKKAYVDSGNEAPESRRPPG
jgi:tetratricopeptide (TPR) repeat protein